MSNDFEFSTTRTTRSSHVPTNNNTSYMPSRNTPAATTLPYSNPVNPVTADYSGEDFIVLDVNTRDTGADYTNDYNTTYRQDLIDFYVGVGFSVETATAYVDSLDASQIQVDLERAEETLQFHEENPDLVMAPDGEEFNTQVLFPELYKIEVIDKMSPEYQEEFNYVVEQIMLYDNVDYETALELATYNSYLDINRIPQMASDYRMRTAVYDYFIYMGEDEETALEYSFDYREYCITSRQAIELVSIYVGQGFSEEAAKEYVYELWQKDITEGTHCIAELINSDGYNREEYLDVSSDNIVGDFFSGVFMDHELYHINPELYYIQQNYDRDEELLDEMVEVMVETGNLTEEEARAALSGYTREELLAIAENDNIDTENGMTYEEICGNVTAYNGSYTIQHQAIMDDFAVAMAPFIDEARLNAYDNLSSIPLYDFDLALEYLDDCYDYYNDPNTPDEEKEFYAEMRAVVIQYAQMDKNAKYSLTYMEYENQILIESKDEYDLYFEAYASSESFDEDFKEFTLELYDSYLATNPEDVLSYEDWFISNYINNFGMFYTCCFSDWKIARYGDNTNYLNNVIEDEEFLEIAEDHLEDSEIATFNYIFETRGPEAALDYIMFLKDDLNRREGQELADEFLSKLDGSGSDFLVVATTAFGEGFTDFFTNISSLFTADAELDPDDYAMAYIMYALENDSQYMNYLDVVYQIGSTVGNVMPVVLSSTLISALTPDGGTVMIGGLSVSVDLISKVPMIAMGLSVAGGSYEQALESGASREDAYLYGAASGLTAVFLEKFLGSLPGIGKNHGFVLNILKEVGEEELEEFANACYQFSILENDEAFLEFAENLDDVGICALACSAIFSTGETVINNTVVTVNDLEFIATLENPGAYFTSMLRSDFTGENFGELLQQYDPEMYQSYVEFQNINSGNTSPGSGETAGYPDDFIGPVLEVTEDQTPTTNEASSTQESIEVTPEMLQNSTDVSFIIENIYNLDTADFSAVINNYSPSMIEEIYNNSSTEGRTMIVESLNSYSIINLVNVIDMDYSIIDFEGWSSASIVQLWHLLTPENKIELFNNEDASFIADTLVTEVVEGRLNITSFDYILSLLSDQQLFMFANTTKHLNFVIDHTSTQLGRLFDYVISDYKAMIIESGKMSLEEIAEKINGLSPEELNELNISLERGTKEMLIQNGITGLTYDQYDYKYQEILPYVSTELPQMMENFFGDLLPDNYAEDLNVSHHFYSPERFNFNNPALGAAAYNWITGSFYNLNEETYILTSYITHESIHEVARNGITGITGFHINSNYKGINECVTEYFTELMQQGNYATNIDGHMHSNYQYGVQFLKRMVSYGIIDLEQLKAAYINNDVSYFNSIFTQEQLDTFLRLFNDIISENPDVQEKAKNEFDLFLFTIVIEKGLGK